MSESKTTMDRPEKDDPDVPDISAREFIRWIATHHAPENEVLSEATLRMMIADFRMHARRLLGQDAKDVTDAE